MTAGKLDMFLRDQLAQLDAQRPSASRPGWLDGRWDQARAAFTAAVADETGADAAFVAGLLDRREVIRHASPHERDTLPEAADTIFVAAVMAAAVWTDARPRTRKG